MGITGEIIQTGGNEFRNKIIHVKYSLLKQFFKPIYRNLLSIFSAVKKRTFFAEVKIKDFFKSVFSGKNKKKREAVSTIFGVFKSRKQNHGKIS